MAHTGENLATALNQCLEEFNLSARVLTVTSDNASNNDTMVRELELLLPHFRGQECQVRCIAHVLNLVAKAILSPFTKSSKDTDAAVKGLVEELEADEYDVEEEDEIAPDVAAHDALDVDQVEEEADLDGRVPKLSVAHRAQARVALTKVSARILLRVLSLIMLSQLRQLAFKIANSPLLSEALTKMCHLLKIEPKQLNKPCDTRWNSSSDLSQSGLEIQPALDRLVVQAEFNKPGGTQLKRLLMSSDDWTVLRELAPTLNVCLSISPILF